MSQQKNKKMLSEINEKALVCSTHSPTNERTNYTLCYDIDLIRNKKKKNTLKPQTHSSRVHFQWTSLDSLMRHIAFGT